MYISCIYIYVYIDVYMYILFVYIYVIVSYNTYICMKIDVYTHSI